MLNQEKYTKQSFAHLEKLLAILVYGFLLAQTSGYELFS